MKFSKKIKTYAVIPAAASETEKYAAEKIALYLNKIFGIDVEITDSAEGKCGNIISVGGPERNAYTAKFISEAEFDKTVPGPEGIFIKTYGSTLVIAGTTKCPNDFERPTLYAAFEFVERYLGASLAAYTKRGVAGGEFVPEYEELDIGDVEYVKKSADLSYRAACVQYSAHAAPATFELEPEFLDWLVKNRFNYVYTWNEIYEYYKTNGMIDEVKKRGLIFKVGHHDAPDTLMPQRGNKYFPEHYYETHPEFYRLNADGTRYVHEGHHGGQIVFCTRADGFIDTIADNLIEWFKKNPQVKAYALYNKDGLAPVCQCERCKNHTKMENYTYMLAGIAKKLKKELPTHRLDFLVYTDTWEPPTGVEVFDNMMATESTWHISTLRSVGKPDGSCLQGTFFEDNLLAWKNLGVKAGYYDYFMGVYGGRQRYVAMADEMQAMCKRFLEVGFEGTETQMEVFNHWNNLFNFYTFGRTAYNTELSMEDNLAVFTKIFGEGASEIADIIRYAEETLDGQSEYMMAGVYLFRHLDMKRVHEGFERAFAKATTAFARNNIRLMRMVFRYNELEVKEDNTNDARTPHICKKYNIPEGGELNYMRDNFDTYLSKSGYGIAIPVDANDTEFTPDKWYIFE